jgi:glycogen operon protein
MTDLQYFPGDFMTLGVTHMGRNVNFAVAVGDTDEVILKLYKNAADARPEHVIKLTGEFKEGNIFAVTIKNFTGKGYTYIYEAKGVSFIDPYAKLISGRSNYGKQLTSKQKKLVRAYVSENTFDWNRDNQEKKPGIDFQDLIIYKLHVRGFSKLAGGLHKGTYRGITDRVSYLKELGINAILLMPCMEYNEIYDSEPEAGVPEFVSSRFYKGNDYKAELPDDDAPVIIDPMKGGTAVSDLPYLGDIKSKVNYWGYTGFYYFFAPKASYAYAPEKADYEFKQMVAKLHSEGIEVLMEVSIPRATNRSMMLDVLRFWVREYHIDGFKLNLDCIDASLIACDPYLSTVKLIGSGWNTDEIYPREYTPDVKRLGIYDNSFSHDMRRFLKSDEGFAGQAVGHITENAGKTMKINYITDHNGFTLADLYMYDMKHNEENGEHGRDGSDYNYSWNCGTEGPDNRKKIRELRMKMRKNAMTVLLLSQGVPVILAGDEFGNSQQGNNNAYCQDNETGWLNWKKTKAETAFFEYVKTLIAFRKSHPVLHNKVAHKSMDYLQSGIPDLSVHSQQAWYPDYNYYNRCIAILYSGDYALIDRVNKDDSFYIAINMYWDEKEFELPHLPVGLSWSFEMSTDSSEYKNGDKVETPTIKLPGRAVVILKSVKAPMLKKNLKQQKTKKPVMTKAAEDKEVGND